MEEEKGLCVACENIKTKDYCNYCGIFICKSCNVEESHNGTFKCPTCNLIYCNTYLMKGGKCYKCVISEEVNGINDIVPNLGNIALEKLVQKVMKK